MIDEQGQELAENISDDKNQAEDKDREQKADNQFAADETVDQFHNVCFVNTNLRPRQAL